MQRSRKNRKCHRFEFLSYKTHTTGKIGLRAWNVSTPCPELQIHEPTSDMLAAAVHPGQHLRAITQAQPMPRGSELPCDTCFPPGLRGGLQPGEANGTPLRAGAQETQCGHGCKAPGRRGRTEPVGQRECVICQRDIPVCALHRQGQKSSHQVLLRRHFLTQRWPQWNARG